MDEHIVIQHWQRADGDLTLERLRSKMSYGGWTVSAYTHAPGTILARHVHQGDKKDGVLTGSVVVSDGTHDYELGPGDVALIPAGVAHSFTVSRAGSAVCLEATSLVYAE